MIKNKKLLIIPLLSFLCLNNVYADCTKEEIDAFKEIEDEYKVTYEFDKETKTYTLNFYNPEPEKYSYKLIYYNEDNTKNIMTYDKVETKEFGYSNALPGNYKIEIFGITNSCNEVLITKTIELSKYNEYSEDPMCQGIEEFVLCQQTYNKNIDYETFKSRVETYKKSKEKEISKNEQSTNNKKEPLINKIADKIINYIKINYIKVIIVLSFIILLVISIIISLKSLKKSRRLE